MVLAATLIATVLSTANTQGKPETHASITDLSSLLHIHKANAGGTLKGNAKERIAKYWRTNGSCSQASLALTHH